MMEYVEERPPLLASTGMASKIITFARSSSRRTIVGGEVGGGGGGGIAPAFLFPDGQIKQNMMTVRTTRVRMKGIFDRIVGDKSYKSMDRQDSVAEATRDRQTDIELI